MSIFDPNNGASSGGGMTEEQYSNLVQDGEFNSAMAQLGGMSETIAQRVIDYGSVPGELKEFVGNVHPAYSEIAGTRRNTVGFSSYGKRTNAFKSLAVARYGNVNFGAFERDMGVLAANQSPMFADASGFIIPVMNQPGERIYMQIMGVGSMGEINPPDAQQTRAYLRPLTIEKINNDTTITQIPSNQTAEDYLLLLSEMIAPPMYKVAYSLGEVTNGSEQLSVDRVYNLITASTNKHIYAGDIFAFKNNGAYYLSFVDYSDATQMLELTPVLNEETGQYTFTTSILTLENYGAGNIGSFLKGMLSNGKFYGTAATDIGQAGFFNNGINKPVIYFSNAVFAKISEQLFNFQGSARCYIVPAFKGIFNVGNDVYFISGNKKIYKALATATGESYITQGGDVTIPIYNVQEICEGDFDLVKYGFVVAFDGDDGNSLNYQAKWLGLKVTGYVNEQSCAISEWWGSPGVNKTVNNEYEVFDLSTVATVANYTKKLAIKTN